MEPESNFIEEARELDRRGRSLDAWALLDPFPPPEEWTNPGHQAVAALVIESLGGTIRARRIMFRLWRHRDSRPHCRQFMAGEAIRLRGPYLGWKWVKAHPPYPAEEEERHWNYRATLAYLRIQFRDFDRARAILDPLLDAHPGSAWGHAVLGYLFARQDLHEEALAQAQRALDLRPAMIAGVYARNDALLALGRDQEALDQLIRSTADTQCFELLTPLVNLQMELGLYGEAQATLDRQEAMAPLMEAQEKARIAARRCDLASAMLDHEKALVQARAAAGEFPFYAKVAEKLEQAGERPRRKVLPVGFVAQHHLTCGPATLSAIAGFLGTPVAHIELANEICYDGTPDYRERNWAEGADWTVREFAVTFDAVKSLIDRGIPLSLTTVEADSGHAQAVIGYDEFRRVFFVRDPTFRTTTEFLALEALEAQKPFGPRGFAMVRKSEEHRFEGLDLPETDHYDLKHEVDLALYRHDRSRAVAALETFRSAHPDARLRWYAELAVAAYDRNAHARLAALDALLAIYPGVVNWKLLRLDILRELHGREAYRSALRAECEARDAHPLLLRTLARDLHWEAGTSGEAFLLIQRIHRVRLDAWAIATEANILWQRRQWTDAVDLYRIASCLDDKNEALAMNYFRGARWVNRIEEALHILRGRVLRDGGRSSQPAICLYDALDALDRTREAIATLESAYERRPEDAELALTLVRALTSIGDLDQAESRLASTKGIAAPSSWSRTSARLARYRADGRGELAAWNEVLRAEPTASDGHRRVVSLLESLEGRDSARKHIRAACERFPFDWELHMIQWEVEGKEGSQAAEGAVRELLRIDPSSAFAWRELALIASERRSFDEALEAIERAGDADQSSPWQHNVHGVVLERQGCFAQARDAFRRALEVDVDTVPAMQNLIRLSEGQDQRMENLRFVQNMLSEQVSSGDAIMEFADLGQPYLSESELEGFLREWWGKRPDLWQTGSRLAQFLRERDHIDEAVAIMREVCERFPLLPRVWAELAECHGHRDERDLQIEALSQVRGINPEWGYGMRSLATALQRAGRMQDALLVMEQALRHAREDGWNHVAMANLLWRLDRKGEAVDRLAFALGLVPDYSGGWSLLKEWGKQARRPEAVREAAERLIRERPAQPRSWLTSASVREGEVALEEQLAALDRAIELDPLSIDAHEEKARVLARSGRFQEALDLCGTYPAQNPPPLLMVREAWIRWVMGQGDRALARIQEALAADPGLHWGWALLCEWHRERSDLDGEEVALAQLCRLEPGDPARLVELADLRARKKDTSGQVSALRKALAIAPDHLPAFRMLARQLMDERRYEDAMALIRAVGVHHPRAEVAVHTFEWHWRQAQIGKAVDSAEDLARCDRGGADICDRMLEVIRTRPLAKGSQAIEGALAKAIAGGAEGRGFAACVYIGLVRHSGGIPSPRILAKISASDPGGELALARHLTSLGDAWNGSKWPSIARSREARNLASFLRERDSELRPISELYGLATYSLCSLRCYEGVVEWMHDWKERSDLQPYMCFNLVEALQQLGREEEEAEAIARGVRYPIADGCMMHLRLLACLAAQFESREEEAREHLGSILRKDLMEHSVPLFDLARQLTFFQPGQPPRPFRGAPRKAVAALEGAKLASQVLRRLQVGACVRIGRHNRSPRPRIWLFFHRWRWVLVAGAVFLAIRVLGWWF